MGKVKNTGRSGARLLAGLFISFGILAGAGIMLWHAFVPFETEMVIPVKWPAFYQNYAVTETQSAVLAIKIKCSARKKEILKKSIPEFNPMPEKIRQGHQCIEVKNISLPKDIEIISIKPEKLCFDAKKQISKEVFVAATTTGEPPEGYTITSLKVEPAMVNLRGPEEILRDMEFVPTKPVNIKDKKGGIKEKSSLNLPESVELLSPLKLVEISAELGLELIPFEIKEIKVKGINPGNHTCSITPPVIALELQGPQKRISLLNKNRPEVTIDLKGLGPGVYARRAKISLPVDVILVNSSPAVFTVNIASEKHEKPES